MSTQCLYCKKELGCPLLFGKDGHFDADRLYTEKSQRDCSRYEEVGHREKNVREWGYKNFGLGYLRTLHELPALVMEGLRQGEKDELMYENVPNFQDPKLLWSGMTTVEREDVLRYQTDENGQIIVETDSEGVQHKLARPEYHIKAYLCDPDGPIRVDKAVGWVWNINQVIDHILRSEAETGLIVKVKKTQATVAATEKQPKESETTMTAGRTVRTVRTASPAKAAAPAAAPAASAAPAGRRVQPKPAAPAQAAAPAAAARTPARAPAPAAATGRVANPPARRVGPPAGAPGRAATSPAAAAASQVAEAVAAAPTISKDVIESSVFAVVNPMFEELLNTVKACQQAVVDCATIITDIAGQTGGTFQVNKIDDEGNNLVDANGNFIMESPQLFSHPSKIYAYVEGTAFNPEYMQTTSGDDGSEEELVEGEMEVEEGEA